jgi:CBS domain-containing protein
MARIGAGLHVGNARRIEASRRNLLAALASGLQSIRLRRLSIEPGGASVQIANCMTRDPVTVSPHEKLIRAKALMDSGNFRRVPVIESGAMVGILTERDLRAHWGYLESTQVDAAMSPNPITITPDTTAEDAARLMLKHKIGGLPVVENGAVVGIVSTSDILRAFLNVVRASQEVMNG